MGQFVRIIRNPLYWYHTEASLPFISKIMTWVQLWCIIRETSNNRQIPIFSLLLLPDTLPDRFYESIYAQ